MRMIHIVLVILMAAATATVSGAEKCFSIAGRVTVDSLKTTSAMINVWDIADSTKVASDLMTDASGRFIIEGLAACSYLLRFDDRHGNSSELLVDVLDHDIVDLQVVLKPTALSLDEVVVTASEIRMPDRMIIFPDKEVISRSDSGMDLIGNLQLPEVYYDRKTEGLVSTKDGGVVLRINGMPASKNDYKSMDLSLVTRLEYHDNPSLRYGDAAVVVDVYIKRPETGGNGYLSALNTLNTGKGSYMADFKINKTRSQWSAFGCYEFMRAIKSHNEDISEYRSGTGSLLIDRFDSKPMTEKEGFLTCDISYSYVDTVQAFMSSFGMTDYRQPYMVRRGVVERSIDSDNVTSERQTTDRTDNISLDLSLYYQRRFHRNNLMAFNIFAGYIDDNNDNTFAGVSMVGDTVEIATYLEGKKFSIVGDGVVDLMLGSGKLSTGLKYSFAHARNSYKGTMEAETAIRRSMLNPFVEWSGDLGRVSYTVRASCPLTFLDREHEHYSDSRIESSLSLMWVPAKGWWVRNNTEVIPQNPPLGQLNDVKIEDSDMIDKVGNTDLSQQTTVRYEISLGGRAQGWNLYLSALYDYIRKPFMADMVYGDDAFISLLINGRRGGRTLINGSVGKSFFDSRINMSLRGSFMRQTFDCRSYSRSIDTWSLTGSVAYTVGPYSVSLDYNKNRSNLQRGAVLNYGRSYLYLSGRYKWRGFRFAAMVDFNLHRYAKKSETDLPIYHSLRLSRMNGNRNIVRFSVAYNFSWGSGYQSVYKRVSGGDNEKGYL